MQSTEIQIEQQSEQQQTSRKICLLFDKQQKSQSQSDLQVEKRAIIYVRKNCVNRSQENLQATL